MRWVVLLAAALLAPAVASVPEGSGPPVAVEATPAADTTLYVHVRRGGDFPISPQPPDPRFRLDHSLGLATHSVSCVPPGTPLDGLTQKEYTTYYGYAALGPVDYPAGGDAPRPLDPGIAADVRLDPAAPLTLRWFVSTFAGGPTDGSEGPVPVPGVVVRATVRLGERFSPFDAAFNEGPIVAQGQTPPTTLAGPQTAPTPVVDASQATPGASASYAGTVDGTPVYAFTLPLPVRLDAIPQEEGFNLRVDIFQRLPACPDPGQGYVMANAVRVHTSEGLRPRLELREREPLRLNATLEQFVEAQVLHVTVRSPWGLADVDGENATLQVTPAAPFGRRDTPPGPLEHGRERRPLEHLWVWNGSLEPGTYSATYNVSNRAHTASAQATVTFTVGTKATPGPELAAGVALLVAVAAVARRR